MDAEARSGVRGPLSEPPLFFVAGEASGDRLAAEVLRARGTPSFGVGGEASRAAGGELIVELSAITAAGLGDVVRRAPTLAKATVRVVRAIEARAPRSAVLVDYVEANARLGAWLRRRHVRVTWCVAPQIWAWRRWRGPGLARSMDRLATLFRFEVAPWRALGVDARWVGHPAAENTLISRSEARSRCGLGDSAALAIVPGSRPREVLRCLPDMVAAAARVGVPTRLLLAPSLTGEARAWALETAARAGIATIAVDPRAGLSALLPAFDAALVAAGTATLECALAGVTPVIVARADRLAALVLRGLVETPHLGLPNVLLGRRAFVELWQEQATPSALAREAAAALAHRIDCSGELRRTLTPDDGSTFGARVAGMVQ